jgi:hypothetical protein
MPAGRPVACQITPLMVQCNIMLQCTNQALPQGAVPVSGAMTCLSDWPWTSASVTCFRILPGTGFRAAG